MIQAPGLLHKFGTKKVFGVTNTLAYCYKNFIALQYTGPRGTITLSIITPGILSFGVMTSSLEYSTKHHDQRFDKGNLVGFCSAKCHSVECHSGKCASAKCQLAIVILMSIIFSIYNSTECHFDKCYNTLCHPA